MYYDPGWADWNQNALATNLIDGLYLRRGESVSVSNVANPIMAPDGDDMFIKIFKRAPPPPPKEEPPLIKTKFFTLKNDGTMSFL